MESDRITVQIHPNLKYELDRRKEFLTVRYRPDGGFRTASQLAAFELQMIRVSQEDIKKQIKKLENPNTIIQGSETFVNINDYITLMKFAASLNKRKDNKQINIDFSKIKGVKKSDVKIRW